MRSSTRQAAASIPRMLRPGVVVAVVLAASVAGCGGGTKQSTSPDAGRDVMKSFVDAVVAGDADAVWTLLSKPSQRRGGPTVQQFATRTLPGLRRTLRPFASGALPVVVSERLDETFGIVALSRAGQAYAAPLRREGGTWRVELPGPLRIAISGPPPGSRGKFVNQIGIEARGPGGAGLALIYLDGKTLEPRVYAGPKSATVFANVESKLSPGVHTAVAFVSARENAAARAWTFEP
jgi:hypothetical protein